MGRLAMLLVGGLSLAACRPDAYGKPIRVEVPVVTEDGERPADTIRKRGGPRPDVRMGVAEGSEPPGLRPAASVQLVVPRNETLPRGVKQGARVMR